jgi:hypothetical protein
MRNKRSIPILTPKQIMRFKAKYIENSENECWPWIAHCNAGGYGMVTINRSGYLAHRVALAIVGIRSDSLQVRHLCNNPPCVNPRHLCFGTSLEDGADRRAAGTVRNQGSKLVEADIPIIRELSKYLVQREIAGLFNVSRSAIYRVLAKG